MPYSTPPEFYARRDAQNRANDLHAQLGDAMNRRSGSGGSSGHPIRKAFFLLVLVFIGVSLYVTWKQHHAQDPAVIPDLPIGTAEIAWTGPEATNALTQQLLIQRLDPGVSTSVEWGWSGTTSTGYLSVHAETVHGADRQVTVYFANSGQFRPVGPNCGRQSGSAVTACHISFKLRVGYRYWLSVTRSGTAASHHWEATIGVAGAAGTVVGTMTAPTAGTHPVAVRNYVRNAAVKSCDTVPGARVVWSSAYPVSPYSGAYTAGVQHQNLAEVHRSTCGTDSTKVEFGDAGLVNVTLAVGRASASST